MEQTDEDHQATMNELIGFLKEEDVCATRKTVKDDIEILAQEGMDIVVTKSYYNSYFVGCREFEIPEITLLAKTISSNESLTPAQKKKLIGKLYKLLSRYQAEKVGSCIGPVNGRGAGNEKLYYVIDKITEAVDTGSKIAFRLCQPDSGRSGDVCGKDSENEYKLTPVSLVCNDNRFYLLGYDSSAGRYKSYRADRMRNVRVLEELADPLPEKECPKDHTNTFFPPEGGVFIEVTLEFDSDIKSCVIDKLGDDAKIWKSTGRSYYAKKLIGVTPSFYAWVFSYGGRIRILSPESAQETFRHMLQKSLT